MTAAVLLFVVGLAASAFCSGSETGLYRVSRVRLLLDGLTGDWVARGLLWLTNHPTLFVVTALIGNNLANYLISLSVVLMAKAWLTEDSALIEALLPVATSPLIFVYGESLPKTLFYHAPNALLRLTGPLFIVLAVVLLPLSAVLWGLGLLLQGVLGETPLRLRLTLARKELQQVIEEGHELGLLHQSQRDLAQRLFAVASQKMSELMAPITRVTAVALGTKAADALRLARRQQAPVILVHGERTRDPIGYIRVVELAMSGAETIDNFIAIPRVLESDSAAGVLLTLQAGKHDVARVVNERGETVGLIYARDLIARLMRSGRAHS